MQKSIMERLDSLEYEHGQMSYDKQLGILGAEKVFSAPRQDDPSDFKTITDMHQDEMDALSEMEEGNQLIIGGINSIVDTMKTEVFKVRIMNAVNDLIRPLRDQMEILHLQDRLHAAEQHTDALYHYRGIIHAINTLGTPTGGILNTLMLEYRRFTNNPLWSTMRLTLTNILLPMVRGVSNLLFGSGDRRSVEQKILDAIKQQTELMRTGQIDQSQGFFQRFREQGLVGMGARAVGGAVANQFGVNRDSAQEREKKRADGEQVDGGVANWLTDRLFKNQTTLIDRTLSTSAEKNSESLVQQLRDVVLKVTLVDDDYKPVESVTEKTTETKQVSLIKETLKDAHEGIKQDFRSLVENTKSVYSVAKEQFFKAAEYSREAMFVGEVAERQDRAPIDLQTIAANEDITVKAVVGGENFETLTDSVNRTNRHMTNMIDTTVQHRDEEMLQMYNISKHNDSVIRTQIEMQEAANDDLSNMLEINRSQYKVQKRTRRAIMLGNMMKLVGTIAGGVMDVVKGIGGLASALIGAKATRGVFGGGGRRGGRPVGRMPVRGLGIAGIASVGTGLITDRFTEEGTASRRVGDTASTALGWGATGAMVGSVIPGIGTAVGGAVGAVAGALYANRDKFEGVIDGVSDTVTNIGSRISDWWSGTDETDGVFDRVTNRVSAIGDSISNWWSGTDETDGIFDRVTNRVATIGDSISNWWSGTDETDGYFDRVSSRVATIGDSISNWWSNLTSEGVGGRVIDYIKENNAFSVAARGGRRVLNWVRGNDDPVESESNTGVNTGVRAAETRWQLERGAVNFPSMMDRYRTIAERGQAKQEQQDQQRWFANRIDDSTNTEPQLLVEREATRQGVNVGDAIGERGVQTQQQTVSLDGIINAIESTSKETANKSQEELNALGEIREILNSILNVSKDANKKREGGNTPARVSPFDQSTISNVFGG